MVWQATHDCQFAEISVERDDYLRGFEGPSEDLLIARVCRPVGDRFNVVTGVPESNCGPSPDARVEEYLHWT